MLARDSPNMTDIKMQPHASQQVKQLSRIAGVTMLTSRAAVIATLLTCVQSSIGSDSVNNNSAPAKLSATSAQAASSRKAPAEQALERDGPSRSTCAELRGIASAERPQTTGGSSDIGGCAVRSNFGGRSLTGNQTKERIDIATFLAWHMQARNSP